MNLQVTLPLNVFSDVLVSKYKVVMGKHTFFDIFNIYSHDAASGSCTTLCIKINKLLVPYIFSNVYHYQ